MNQRLVAILIVLGIMVLAMAAFAVTPNQAATVSAAVLQTVQPTEVITPTQTIQPTEVVSPTINALVGDGRETLTVNSYFPAVLTVRVGDTVNWKINTDEPHTVSFSDGTVPQGADPATFIIDTRIGAGPDDVLPGPFIPVPGGGPTDLALHPLGNFPTRPPGGPVETWNGTGFASSGVFFEQQAAPPDTPPNDTFQLTFTEPGTYRYICLIHYASMQGVVNVVPADTADVPSQADVDAEIQKEMANKNKIMESAIATNTVVEEPGPDDHTIWNVRNGNTAPDLLDVSVQLLRFGPENLTIKVGDTVVWSSSYFHNVTFSPTPPPPDFILPQPQENGPPLLVVNPLVLLPAKPNPIYDPTQLYNSGILTPGGPFGTSWQLTFNEPGTYEYYCTVNILQGMKGTIVVTP
jgi:plastocyanin